MASFESSGTRLMAAAQVLGAYAGGDANVALVRWIDAAIEVYKEDLLTVTPADLLALQTKVLQLQALRALAMGAVQTNGRI